MVADDAGADDQDAPDGTEDAGVTGEVARVILGGEPRYTSAEVADRTGVPLEQAQRLWRTLGFPQNDRDAAYTDADVEALATLGGTMDSGLIDFDLALSLTRALGQNMARLADWEVSAMAHRVEELSEDRPGVTRAEAAIDLFEGLSEPFEELMLYVWRRHLTAAVSRIFALGSDGEGETDLDTTRLSVGFADIVSFTALSNQISRGRIGDLVELFESRCADVVANQHGRVIKSIGDSVLFVNDDPIRAYDTAEGIINVIGRDSRMPDVRVGLATGDIVTRLGDVFGPPVNMAARLTAVARRNRIIIDAATAALLPANQFETRRLPARPVRGFGVIEPVAVRRH